MQTLKTLDDFFIGNEIHYRVYDMGRGIRKFEQDIFRKFELGQVPWPFPLQQHAWLAILGWRVADREDHFIWFLRFPLDEQGLLIQATRDDFMTSLLHTLGHNLHAAQQGGQLEDGMNQSPYGFKPRESAMAAFHAIAARKMGQTASRYYSHAKDYLDGKPGYDQWAFVGIQGLADVVARLDKDDNLSRLQRAIPQLPPPALIALCGLCENEVLPASLTEALLTRLQQEQQLDNGDRNLLAALLRAVAQTTATGLREQAVDTCLAGPHAQQIEILAAIAARHWTLLQDASRAGCFVDALAQNSLGQDGFNQLMADLLFIPGMRAPLLAQLRSPERSPALGQAMAGLFG